MAKTPNGLGQYSGKVGGVVYAVQNGQQIVRSYQPVVRNPKSLSQRLQRAKANLVGQLSSVVPWQILEGLGANRRARRSRFLRLALNATTAQVSEADASVLLAKLPNDKFVFSEGALTPAILMANPAATAFNVSFTLQRYPDVPQSEFLASGALAVVVIKTTDGLYESVLYRFVPASEIAATSGGVITVTFQHLNDGAYYADFYLAPFRTDDGSALRAKADALYGTDADFNAQMVYNPSALPLVWGDSRLYHSVTFTPQP